MSEFLSLLLLPPIFRGFIGMMISGICFPLCGVMVVRMKLIPLRYMLMHGVVLGGAIALGAKLPLIPVIIFVNIILILLMILVSKNQSFGFSGGSAAIMVISMALASIISHVKDIPSKDSLNILWGSPFALSVADIIILCFVLCFLLLFVIFNFNNILALFYNREVAVSMGLKEGISYNAVIIFVSFVVALGMKLLGAFLIDALLILPVLCSSSLLQCVKKGTGIKKLFVFSCITGFVFASAGYLTAVVTDCPPSGVIALFSGVIFIITSIVNKIINRKKHKEI